MQSVKDILILDTVLEAEPLSFLWKLLSGVLKLEKFNFTFMTIPVLQIEAANFCCSPWLTMGLLLFSHLLQLFTVLSWHEIWPQWRTTWTSEKNHKRASLPVGRGSICVVPTFKKNLCRPANFGGKAVFDTSLWLKSSMVFVRFKNQD